MTAQLLIKKCGYGAYERGRDYFIQGRADIVETRDDGFGRLTLISTARGSSLYGQEIILKQSRQSLEISGFCDCPMDYNCKHVVAACLAWKAEMESTGKVSSGDFEQWLGHFTGQGEKVELIAEEKLLYHLSPARRQGNGIRVAFSIAKRKRNGEWGKGRQVTLSTLTNHYSTPRYMQPLDEDIVALLKVTRLNLWSGDTILSGVTGHTALMLMVESGRAFWGEERATPLQLSGEREAILVWTKKGDQYQLGLELAEDGQMLPVNPPCYIDPEHSAVGELQLLPGITADKIALLAKAPPVSASEARRISHQLALHHPELPTPEPVQVDELHEPPVAHLSLHFNPERPFEAAMSLAFRYGKKQINPTNPAPVITCEKEDRLLHIHRDFEAEAAARATLLNETAVIAMEQPGQFILHSSATPGRQTALNDWFDFLDTAVPRLEARGWVVEPAPESPFILSHAEAVDAEVDASENDWFGLRFDLEVEGKKLPLLPLVSELLADYQTGELPEILYLDAGDGRYITVAASQIEPVLQTIVDLYDRGGQGGESLRLSRLDAPRLLELGETRVRGGATLQALARRLRNFEGIKPAKVPTTFKGTLRGYQQQGLDWLQFLRKYQLAGILADDMGLGKTVQALAHLAIEKRAGRMKHPSLIVAPTSLMGNWRREAAQFTPGLKVLVLHGPERSEHFATLDNYDIILTTYPLLPRDHEVLLAKSWHYLILDEAQQIKNPRSQAAQLVRELQAKHRLCLTGTPMENHLGELWAQFDFLLPGFLGDQKSFVRHYRTPIEKQGDNDKLKRLTQRTAPFMLRRTKEVVASELPPKSELLRTVPIEGRQAALYESIRLSMEKKVRDAIARKGLARSHITILDALLKLRQVCCDPRLLPAGTGGVKTGKPIASAKLAMLMELLPEMLDEGRRILLFSQFTSMLSLIEEALQGENIAYTKLTGQTRKRDEAIETFRSGEVNLFLISLKAGGVGLNLTEADTVIHYDPWWNPAVEMQATDRAHRIGQQKPVFVYKLITEGTVEEKILAMQAKKQQLANNVYGKGKKEGELLIDASTLSDLLAAD